MHRWVITGWLIAFSIITGWAQSTADLMIVELNTENLFDTQHDSLKNDYDFLPDGAMHWTRTKYWQKINRIAQAIVSCGADSTTAVLPDLMALCEVENDSVLRDLTKRSLLRKARYQYVMTSSPDERGIDVALLYSPFTFRLIGADTIRINPLAGFRPTRDILYVKGEVITGDTLHCFVVHAPSRRGGEMASRPYRLHVAQILAERIDSLSAIDAQAHIIVAGDFNDYTHNKPLTLLQSHHLVDVSAHAIGTHGAKGTYRYQGEWGSLDHILVSEGLATMVSACYINDQPFLLEEDKKYGGVKPRRNYIGMKSNHGYSDHLPLVLKMRLDRINIVH